jgi:opacity protein-like surface antigen
MIKKITIILFICVSFTSKAQLDEDYFGIGAGLNFLSYKGDLNVNKKATALNNFRAGIDINAEKRWNNIFGTSINFLYGNVAQNDFSSTSLNFKSSIIDVSLNGILYFDNNILLDKQFGFTPFIGIGAGFFLFNPYGDLKDKNGNTYYFWEDGSVKDIAEDDENAANANNLSIDYVYETKLTNPNVNYKRNAFSFPLTLGINTKITDNIALRVSTTMHFTTTDYIDNVSFDNKKDKFISTRMGLFYAFGKPNTEHHHKLHDIDLNLFHKHDSDEDGVADMFDECPHTIKGIPVDKKGCPLDSDGDGVYDHLDKEPNTPFGNHVDQHGVTISDEEFQTKYLKRDSLLMNKITKVIEAPSIETLKNIERESQKAKDIDGSTYQMPEEFKIADGNGDGILQAEEILKMLDDFLEGEIDISIETLYEMIDYFFEQ